MYRLLACLLFLSAPRPAAAGPAPQPGWKTAPYVQPQAGLSTFTTGGRTVEAATLGAQAGLRYWQVQHPLPRWKGDARARVTAVVNSGDAQGYDARLGNFIGPAWKTWSLRSGPDLFTNRYQVGSQVLDPAVGLEWPVIGAAKLDIINVYAGLAPAWLIRSERDPVDWDAVETPGFGDEFSYFAGAGFNLGGLALGARWSYRITAMGGQQSLGLSVNLRP